MTNRDERWLSIREAALALGTSELTVRRRIKDGRLTSKLEGGKYFVCLDAPSASQAEGAPRGGSSATAGENGSASDEADAATPSTVPVLHLDALFAEQSRLAEAAGRASLLEAQLRGVEERYVTLQESAMALANRNGWLESKLEEREREIKLLSDSQHKVSWWRRLFGGS